ncbi:hypothetical protein D3C84_950230 [compost metagenome]
MTQTASAVFRLDHDLAGQFSTQVGRVVLVAEVATVRWDDQRIGGFGFTQELVDRNGLPSLAQTLE